MPQVRRVPLASAKDELKVTTDSERESIGRSADLRGYDLHLWVDRYRIGDDLNAHPARVAETSQVSAKTVREIGPGSIHRQLGCLGCYGEREGRVHDRLTSPLAP